MVELRISIDGPTASGKTTLGTFLAQRYQLAFLDTGLTYRGLSFAMAHETLDPSDDWASALEHRPLTWIHDQNGQSITIANERIYYRGLDISDDIFAPELEKDLRAIASNPSWRKSIVAHHQRVVQRQPRVVVVGRDVAEQVLPDATLHIALTASLVARRERRRAQYRNIRNRSTAVGQVTDRDLQTWRLVVALPNSVVLDTTYLPAVAVAKSIVRRLEGFSVG